MNYCQKGINFLLITGVLLFLSCEPKIDQDKLAIISLLEEIKQEFAPDKRVALFNVEFVKSGELNILKGESDLPVAVATLKENLAEHKINFIDQQQSLNPLTH